MSNTWNCLVVNMHTANPTCLARVSLSGQSMHETTYCYTSMCVAVIVSRSSDRRSMAGQPAGHVAFVGSSTYMTTPRLWTAGRLCTARAQCNCTSACSCMGTLPGGRFPSINVYVRIDPRHRLWHCGRPVDGHGVIGL